jgi:hypothetical protein
MIAGSRSGCVPLTKRIQIMEAQKHTDPTDPDTQFWFSEHKSFIYTEVIRKVYESQNLFCNNLEYGI